MGTTYPAVAWPAATPAAPPPIAAPPAVPASSQYGQWARGEHPQERPQERPLERPQGTVYGGGRPVRPTVHSGPPLESSGSLTGHILSRGAPDVPPPKARTARVIVILGVALGVVVVVSFVIAIFFRDTLNQLFSGFFSGT